MLFAVHRPLDEQIRLKTPRSGRLVSDGSLLFSWTCRLQLNGLSFSNWELSFVEITGIDTLRISNIAPEKPIMAHIQYYRLRNIKRYLKQNGTYRWAVSAIYTDGTRHISKYRTLIYKRDFSQPYFADDASLYEVRYSHIKRTGSNLFVEFKHTLANSEPFMGYSDLDLIFHQKLGYRVHIKERLMIQSGLGLGVGFALDLRLFKNDYFALHPYGAVEFFGRSEGIRNYSSSTKNWSVGCHCIIMPGGYLTLKAAYIPAYNIRYIAGNDRLMTFNGKGWKLGLRLILSRKFIKPVSFFGKKLDLRRIPVEYTISQVKDVFTNITMKQINVSIGYLF